MPLYEFQCKKCSTVYDEIVRFDETNKYKGVVCPHCGSKRKEKLLASRVNFTFAQPEGTDRWNSDANGHDYRFKHKLPQVIAERQAAEEAGGSAEPYNPINDIDSDTNWGEVK